MTIPELIQSAARKVGGAEALCNITHIQTRGSFVLGTLQGTISTVQEFSDPFKHIVDLDLGAFKQLSGYDGNSIWTRDTNGKISVNDGDDGITASIVVTKFAQRRFLFEPEKYDFTLSENDSHYILGAIDLAAADKYYGKITLHINKHTLLIDTMLSEDIAGLNTTKYADYVQFGDVVFARDVREVGSVNEQHTIFESIEINPALEPHQFDRPLNDVQDYRFKSDLNSCVVPLRIPIKHIYATVRIGDADCSFVVDTGASVTVISNQMAHKLGLESQGTMQGSGVSGTQELNIVSLPELCVGDVVLQSQQIIAMDFTRLNQFMPEADGILGMDFLNRFVIKLDYVRKEMTVFDRDHFQYSGVGISHPLDGININMSIDGSSGKFRIDTGAPDITLHTPFVKKLGLLNNSERMPTSKQILGIGTNKVRMYSALCYTLSIGSVVFNNPPAHLADMETGTFAEKDVVGNVGGLIWERFICYFDFTSNYVILEPNVNISKPFYANKHGFSIKQNDAGYVVNAVTSFSPAAEQNIRAGDRLIAINGVPAVHYTLDEILLLLRKPAGTQFIFDIVTEDKQERRVELALREYIRHYDDY